MRVLTKALLGTLASLALAACGGGGGGGNDSAFQPQGITVNVSPANPSSTPSSLVSITVRVTGERGAPLPDGTTVRLQVSPPGVGLVSSVQAAVPPNAGGSGLLAEAVNATLSGGLANFRLHTRAVGTATLTASVTDPNAPQRTVTGTASVSVAAGAPSDPRISIQLAGSSTLPVNPIGINYNSPYFTPVTVTWRNLDGSLVTPRDDEDFVGVSVLPTETAFFTFLDDPDTTDINENLVALGQGPANVVAGRAFFRVFSSRVPGTATLTVSAVDQLTGETVSATQEFRVTNGTPGVPGAVIFDTDVSPVYVQGVDGPQTKPIQVVVFDGGGALVPNPPAGVNNLRVEMLSTLNGGERITGVNAAGTPVSGQLVQTRTNNGEAGLALQAGTVPGTVTLRATADRADNNVDNGIADPVVTTRQVVISDGKVFDIEITNASVSQPTSSTIGPPDGSGRYNATIGVVATDRAGNPVPAGTPIRFGLIDEPQAAGAFQIAGNDGDPQESGTLFTAPGGAFTTAGAGVGPGDTLVVFGEDVAGNRDLESARRVTQVLSPTQLTVDYRFNANDDTGTSVNSGPILPYIIGRAVDGNIVANGATNAAGFATSVMNYPASKLGKRIVLWAQASGDFVNGSAERISDVEFSIFQGSGTPRLTALPSPILANRTVPVTVCLTDAANNPLPNQAINFAFNDIGAATANADGIAGSGSLPNRTGLDGCVVTQVTTANFSSTTACNASSGTAPTGPRLSFNAGAANAAVCIQLPGTPAITVAPSGVTVFTDDGTITPVQVFVSDGGGAGLPNVPITVACTATANAPPSVPPVTPSLVASPPAGTTNAQGLFTVGVTFRGFIAPTATAGVFRTATGTCTFTAPGIPGNAVLTVASSTGFCDGFSPPPPLCGG